jgi:hypothetical protein
MSIRSNRARLERLETRAGARYVIGQDRERDRKRWQELRSRHSGFTEEEAVEKAKLEASFSGENREGRAPYELLSKSLAGTLTPEEEIEYAEQKERHSPHLSPRHKELVQMLRAITQEGANQIGASDQGRAAISKQNDGLPQKQIGSATFRCATEGEEKLPPASPEIASDAELLNQLKLAANHNVVPGDGIEDVGPIKAMLECGVDLDDVLSTLRSKVDPRAYPKNKSLAAWSDHSFIMSVAETYGRRVMLPMIKEKLGARSSNEA